MGNPSQSYGASPATRDHAVSPAIRHQSIKQCSLIHAPDQRAISHLNTN